MARNQIIYNVEDVFIGPCPASGYHFINYSGKLNNNYEDFPYVTYESFQHISPNSGIINAIIPKDKNENTFPRNHNLIKRLDRIQNISYEIISTRTPISEIGRATVLNKIQLNKPEINISFSYILSSLRNEARMGFDINYPRLDYPYTGDKYFYRTDNGNPLFLFSGFFDRNYLKKYQITPTNRGEGTALEASPDCFQFIQPATPNPNFISNYIPFWIGKNLSPAITFVNLNTTDVAAGFYHLFALINGSVTGWGDNSEGQLTNNVTSNDVSGIFTGNWDSTIVGQLAGVKKISTNYLHTLAILSGDLITGWGTNDEGQAVGTVGYNDNNYLFTGNWINTPVSNITGASGISAGAYHSLALLKDKTITGWGNNTSGQALSGNNLTGIIGISAGGHHSLAIRNINGGTVTGWGDDDYFQSSSGNILTGVRMVSAGYLHSFALLNNGKITGWGWNDDGQIAGITNLNNSSGIFTGNWDNTIVGQLTGVKSIHAGWFHTLALLENNKITGWGFNNAGQLNENISYNDINGVFTGNWDSTIVGSFSNILNVDTSAQNSISLISNQNEITGWGETDANYDLLKNQIFKNDFKYDEYDCITDDPYWPLSTKDKRNIFIAISDKEIDHNNNFENFNLSDKQDQINVSADKKSKTTNTIGVGNCYLTSYSQSASVGNFIRANVSYLGENMLFQMSGSGARTPYIDPKTYLTNSGNDSIKFNIPGEVDNRNPIAALLPGDIEVEIYSSDGYGLDFKESHVQGYEFNFTFDRENFNAIGYKLPIDREINLPLTINLSIDFSLGEHVYNDLANLIHQDKYYRAIIKCRNNQRCSSVDNYIFFPTNQSSEFEKRFDYAFVYEFSNLKFENINYSNEIGARKNARIAFTTEVNTENYNQGLQISGLLGIDKIEDFILIESGSLPALAGTNTTDGSYLLQEDENLLVSNLSILY